MHMPYAYALDIYILWLVGEVDKINLGVLVIFMLESVV